MAQSRIVPRRQDTSILRSPVSFGSTSTTGSQSFNPEGRRRFTSPIRAALWRWRWVLLALVATTTIHNLANGIRAQVPDDVAVVVAARPLVSGQLLDDSDITLSSFPVGEAESFFTNYESDPAEFIGKHVIAPIPQGGPLYREQILDEAFVDLAPPGTVMTSIPLADNGSLELITVGSHIDLYAPPDEFDESHAANLVAKDVLVVGKAVQPGTSTFLSEVSDTVVFHVAIPRSIASVVIGIGARTPFHAVLATADE